MTPGVQFSSANTTVLEAVSVRPTPAAVSPSTATRTPSSFWKLSTSPCLCDASTPPSIRISPTFAFRTAASSPS
eukprot:CAMPEP_0114139222 /NCGR_PEP_ID=MMETSP0043_2-20121206/16741_1 /TAXON_ID=464988 /ORGANISM="Hemiselmis andersenii, Strain CCMP644" /LENGTH=73 /DNA_ID=CAMNT_0001233245 /DNA_START=129 /DNA_END=347 /DNA_ORIENTATION=+